MKKFLLILMVASLLIFATNCQKKAKVEEAPASVVDTTTVEEAPAPVDTIAAVTDTVNL
ncbi:MAG: hypothetical protein PHS99_09105 [Candidatus Marinimicrobia bacterium]|nr:hypothetical protein [Candidatus Neomarinimicrobiota bacterium]